MTSENDLVFLITAHKRHGHVDVPISLLVLCNGRLAANGVTGKHRPQELEGHLAADIVHIAAELRRQGRRQETLNHQTSLLIMLDMLDTLTTGKLTKPSHILLGQGAFPRSSIPTCHCITSHIRLFSTGDT